MNAPGQTADTRGCHNAALLNGIIQHREDCGRTAAAADLQTNFLQNTRNRVTDRRRRCERQVNDAERHTQALACQCANQLAPYG